MPVCIYNNKAGVDAKLLKEFKEPSWNNPVVRIMDHARVDRVPANRRGWTVADVAKQIVAALEKRGRPVPGYVKLLAMETESHRRGVQKAVFGMT